MSRPTVLQLYAVAVTATLVTYVAFGWLLANRALRQWPQE